MYRGHQFQMRGTCTFQEQSLYSNDRRGEDLVSPSFEGRKHGGEDWGYLLETVILIIHLISLHIL